MTYTPSTKDVNAAYTECILRREGLYPDHSGHNEGVTDGEFDRWFAAEEQRIRADERAKIAAAIRSGKANGDVVGDETWNDGMERAAKIAERAS